MPDFVLVTETNSDLPIEYYKENDIEVMYMTFTFDDVILSPSDITPKEFYEELRKGKLPVTAQTNIDEWMRFYEPILQAGKDILSISFSSGLSGTCNNAKIAAADLLQKYPERKLIVVDSLCASMGLGLLVHKADRLRKAGKSIEEVAAWAEENKLKVCHGVAVNDLMHLHRGGRLPVTSAVAGSLLGIKPIITVNNEGKLENSEKIRGRKQSLTKMADNFAALSKGAENDIFMVSHSDCEEEADFLVKLVREKTGIENCIISYISPAVGSHTGVGTVALFMMGTHR